MAAFIEGDAYPLLRAPGHSLDINLLTVTQTLGELFSVGDNTSIYLLLGPQLLSYVYIDQITVIAMFLGSDQYFLARCHTYPLHWKTFFFPFSRRPPLFVHPPCLDFSSPSNHQAAFRRSD